MISDSHLLANRERLLFPRTIDTHSRTDGPCVLGLALILIFGYPSADLQYLSMVRHVNVSALVESCISVRLIFVFLYLGLPT